MRYLSVIFYLIYRNLPSNKKSFLKAFLIRFFSVLILWLFVGGILIETIRGQSYFWGMSLALVSLLPLLIIGLLLNRKIIADIVNKEIRDLFLHIIGFVYLIIPTAVIIAQMKMYRFITPYERGCIEGTWILIFLYLTFIVSKSVTVYSKNKNSINQNE